MRITNAADYHEPRDAISHDWIARLDSWGMVPLLIPNGLHTPEQYLKSRAPDLLVLTGGDDLDDKSIRDQTEKALVQVAIDNNIPVLGICRGMQLLNRVFGGTNIKIDGHVNAPHPVSFNPPWDAFLGAQLIVNSFHGTGISAAGLAPGLRPVAVDEAGLVEAFVHKEVPVYGVMWHPERDVLNEEKGRDLFVRLMHPEPASP